MATSTTVGDYILALADKRVFTTYRREQRRRDLQVGDLVLIIGDTYARNNWHKGLVVSIDPGEDGPVRQAKIRTSKGTIIRDIRKICLLEGADDRTVEDRKNFQSDCG
ncbi:unnamed protein product [Schistosoma curassoni]|uniref:DUF5641 domain-containing protein n=1 Tax=Schistosoma curassoni TaxID=6186 RepID=A0A183JME4_9TREM|nr:unnamed protein product [Schistosoma curassoni]